jgi:hypothetical protein
MNRRRCPVCRRAVLQTSEGNIQPHSDTTGYNMCPMSHEPYRCAEIGRPRRVVAKKKVTL